MICDFAVKPTISNPTPVVPTQQQSTINAINNFNNNMRNNNSSNPHCVAQFDFIPENTGELGFKVNWRICGKLRKLINDLI